MHNLYAGIGSRETPHNVLSYMRILAEELAKRDWCLRSGGANGADSAFEKGCDQTAGAKEIFLPWKDFNGSKSELFNQSYGAFLLAEAYHPNWSACKTAARKLHARNVHQILGLDLDTPVKFVVCYTKDGKRTGGTGQALRIAEKLNIPIVDYGAYKDPSELTQSILDQVGSLN